MTELDVQTYEIVGDIYEASYRPEHWPHVLKRIADVTGSRSALMMYQDRQCGRATATWYYNLGADEIARFNNANTPDPTLLLAASQVPLGTATTNHFLIPDEADRRAYYGDFYDDMLIPHDMYYVGGVVLINEKDRALAIGIHRGAKDEPWAQQEVDRLTALSPHIQRALNIHREFTQLRNRELAMQTGLDRMVLGVILIDHLFECVYCNPAAEEILDQANILSLENGKLAAKNPWEREELGTAIAKAAGFGHGDRSPAFSSALGLSRIDKRVTYPVLVTPALGIGQGLLPDIESAQIAVLISDPEREQPIVAEALQSIWGLTPAEARVAIAIANGHSLANISEIRKTRLTTTKSHLRQIYKKLGVARQSEVVRILLTGPFRVKY